MALEPTGQVEMSTSAKDQGAIFAVIADDDGLKITMEGASKAFRLSTQHDNYAALVSLVLSAQANGGWLTIRYSTVGSIGRDTNSVLAIGVGVGAVVLGAI